MLSDWIAEIPAYSPGGHRISKPNRRKRLLYVRYADDFAVLHPDQGIVESAKQLIDEFLAPIGLELHLEKTKITHTYLKINDSRPGFKFLGFWIRNYEVGKTKRGKRGAEYKTFIRPHPQNIADVLRKTKVILRQSQDVTTVVNRINPIIRGWANYFSTVASKRTFSAMDKILIVQLMRWCKRKHPTRSKTWCRNQYLHRDTKKGKSRLRFGYIAKGQEIIGIKYFAERSIVRHTKITGNKSIYDNDIIYWAKRGRPLGNRSKSESVIRLLQKQKNRCNMCGLMFLPGDIIEIDHIKPKKLGGSNSYENLQVLHGHCHDKKQD